MIAQILRLRTPAKKAEKQCELAKLIVALSRYGGLRCPSEHFLLRWEDILWDQQRFIVHSPKTEKHQGRETRIVPLFPELLPFLEVAFDQAEPGQEFVIHRERTSSENLRTQLTRIVKKAGLVPWPRLTHNLRSSRATELADVFPSKVAADWLGHTEVIADRHYRQTTREHFERAVKGECIALHNPVQSGSETPGNERNTVGFTSPEATETAEKPAKTWVVNKKKREWMGIEPT